LALQEVSQHSHGLVISGYKLKDMYYRDLAESLPKHFELVLLGSAGMISSAESGILSLTTPLKVYDLVNTAEMVLRQMEWKLKKDKKPKRRSEREENYIRNAKNLLMERNHLTEEEAHRYIQKSSMDNATNMVETAQMILTLLFEEG
ncbi:MAG: ANTAR domain-containing protein, partial [Clostridia bacterium]|nr:ANTAR domain-containing protein [Clostridia bacterium]